MVGRDRVQFGLSRLGSDMAAGSMSISVLEPIVTTLVENGVFGNVSYLGLQTDDTVKGAQFSSTLFVVNLSVGVPEGEQVLPLVIKLPLSDPELRKARNSDTMFHNEVAMYKEVLPQLRVGKDFCPRMFYGLATNGAEPEKDILVLENLKFKDFHLSKTRPFLDIDHISVATKKIAEFHSLSFIHKHKNKESFLEMAKKLKVIDLIQETENEFNMINAACIERGIKPLLKENVSVDLLTDCLSLLKNPIKTRDMISSPEEPFAVICHGDFCNNNILYKFDENGKPTDCSFVDFQFSMYGSPAIDLFFFLYLNTTSELREKYWDMILKLYWDTLRKCVPNQIPLPSFEDFLKHFAERVIYGYTIASFFLPEMMVDKNQINEDDIRPFTLEEKIERMTSVGGKEGEKKISEIVLHLLDKGYIHAYIELCKNKKFEC